MNNHDKIGTYKIRDFSINRQISSAVFDEFLKKHYMIGYIEANISFGKQVIQEIEKLTGERISFNAWVAKCISDIVVQYPEFNSFRKGKNKIIEFDDVDIIILVERSLIDKKIAIPVSVRKCNEKNVIQISQEIRTAQSKGITEEDQLLQQGKAVKFYNITPKFIKKRLLQRWVNNPFYMKKNGGLILLTSISAFTNTLGWVGISGGLSTLEIALGGKSKKLVKIENNIVEQEYLQITVHIDHDLIDGAPAARFCSLLVSKLENGYLINELLQNFTKKQ